MAKTKSSSAKILRDLDSIYKLAMTNQNFAVALKVKELLGRMHGLFSPKRRPSSKKGTFSINKLSEEDLDRLIQELEAQLKLDP